jgi:hypothetical protein
MRRLRTICPPMGAMTALITAILLSNGGPTAHSSTLRAPPNSAEAGLAPSQTRLPTDEAQSLATLDDFGDDIWQRPLFADGRRPPSAIVPPPADVTITPVVPEPEPPPLIVETPTMPNMKMRGSMTQGGVVKALVSLPETGAELWVAEGYEYGGWTLTKISQGAIQMRYGDTEISIQLFE